MSAEIEALLKAVRDGLKSVADPSRAPKMQSYMKSKMPYWGVDSTTMRRTVKAAFDAHPLSTPELWRDAVLQLWRQATHREEWYAAIELLEYKRYRPWRTLAMLPVYEELIVSGAWWDVVDVLASHRIGELLRHHPDTMKPLLLQWSASDNLWKRRTAIIAQLGRRDATDLELLYRCIEPALAEKEFFLRKAIGWALRDYAWTDPDEVVRYVETHPSLSGLSKREALKNLDKIRASGVLRKKKS